MSAGKGTSGKPFELAVAAVQSLLDPDTIVTHNEWLTDRIGQSRQYDVVVRGHFGGQDILGIIECKDWRKRVGTPEVNAFADKASNLRANLKLIASRSGFSSTALKLARYHGIGTISLTRDSPQSDGVPITLPSYAQIYDWTRYRIVLPEELPLGISGADATAMKWHDLPVTAWALHAIRAFAHIKQTGLFRISVAFSTPAAFRVGELEVPIPWFTVEAVRDIHKKVRTVNWYGKAFYEWSEQKVIYPGKTDYVSEWYRSDLSDWDDYDGEIPPLIEGNPFDIRVEMCRAPIVAEPPVDLRQVATLQITRIENDSPVVAEGD